MITKNDILDALTMCAGYANQLTPQANKLTVAAWLDHFGQHPGITRDDLRFAVREYFNQPQERQIQPVDLSRIARKYVRERIERSDLDSSERLALEAKCDALAAEEPAAIEGSVSGQGSGTGPLWVGGTGEAPAEVVAAFTKAFGDPTRPRSDVNYLTIVKQQTEGIRKSAPPAPLTCPDCGQYENPCVCTTNETRQEEA